MLILSWIRRKQHGIYFIVIALLCVLTSFSWNTLRKPSISPLYQNSGQELILKGNLIQEPSFKDFKASFVFRTDQGHRIFVTAKILSDHDKKVMQKLTNGSRIQFNACVEDPQKRFTHGGILKDYLMRNRFQGAVSIENLENLEILAKASFVISLAQQLRDFVSRQIDKVTANQPLRQLLKGMLLGDFPRDTETYLFFQEIGLAHFLAVSGYHFYFLMGILMVLLYQLGVMTPHREWIILLILGIYLVLGGFQVSALRAFIMSSMLLLAIIYRERYDPGTAWCISALILLLWNPWLLFQPGFQLTFLGSLLVIELSHLPWGLWLLPIPLMAIASTHFNMIQPLGMLIVFLFAPLLAFFFIGAWLTILLGWISLLPLGWILEQSFGYFYWLVRSIQSFSWMYRFIAFPTLPYISFAYTLLLVSWILTRQWFFRKKQKLCLRITLVLCVLPLILIFVPSYHPKYLEVTFINIGQGDAIFIQLPEKKNILVDAGPGPSKDTSWDPGRHLLLPFLRSKGINKIDALVLTHFHDDHFGGLKTVFEHIPTIDLLIYPAYNSSEAKGFEDFYHSFSRKAQRTQPICVDQPIALDQQSFITFYGPSCDTTFMQTVNENNRSLVFKLTYGSISILFTGDIEYEGEQKLMERFGGELSSQILKVPHHGSKSSTSELFLDLVQPLYAVISSGKNNLFGHPSLEVRERLENRGIIYYITHQSGHILLQSDGKEIQWQFSMEH